MDSESRRVQQAYERRKVKGWSQRYSWFQPGNLYMIQERERALLEMLKASIKELNDKRILDIGCGSGSTLLPFVAYGAKLKNCFGVDILSERIEKAKIRFPNMTFACASAESIPFERGSFDLVTMFTCLSSILDEEIRRKICLEAAEMLRPGGWILVYDFRVNNPKNHDVKAVKLKELKNYFPDYRHCSKSLTLLPPLSRIIAEYSTIMCNVLGLIPFLRTHQMSIFQKPNK